MSKTLHLFEGYGVELEYMLVARDTLDVRPVTDEVLKKISGSYDSEVERGDLAWSNELVLHVIELKTNGPVDSLSGLADKFQHDVREINNLAQNLGAKLMPSAAHPWMDPHAETQLWPHEYSPVYEAFDRIFSCQGHGWSNLQSTHLNLPFNGDEEFARLHAAIRLVLPILPALSASSPILDSRVTGHMDARLDVYRGNARRIPSVSGRVIPERAFSKQEYEERILQPMYRDIAPHDPDGILQYEWLNARGAIARFDRNAIEIRVLDIQECPAADIAILELIIATIRALTEERWTKLIQLQAWGEQPLEAILLNVIRDAENAPLADPDYLAQFGANPTAIRTAGDLWKHLAAELDIKNDVLDIILNKGCLARRILQAAGRTPTRETLAVVYNELCDCLAAGTIFRAAI